MTPRARLRAARPEPQSGEGSFSTRAGRLPLARRPAYFTLRAPVTPGNAFPRARSASSKLPVLNASSLRDLVRRAPAGTRFAIPGSMPAQHPVLRRRTDADPRRPLGRLRGSAPRRPHREHPMPPLHERRRFARGAPLCAPRDAARGVDARRRGRRALSRGRRLLGVRHRVAGARRGERALPREARRAPASREPGAARDLRRAPRPDPGPPFTIAACPAAQFRNLVLLAAAAAIGWWIYKDRPTLSGFIDSLTNPLMGSHAAVESSERNRVVGRREHGDHGPGGAAGRVAARGHDARPRCANCSASRRRSSASQAGRRRAFPLDLHEGRPHPDDAEQPRRRDRRHSVMTLAAAPKRPSRQSITARTGIRESSSSMGGFAWNARRNAGRFSSERIRGAIPPPT